MPGPGVQFRLIEFNIGGPVQPGCYGCQRMRFGDFISADGEAEQHISGICWDMSRAVLCFRDADPDSYRQLHAHDSSVKRLRFGDYVNADGESEQHSLVVSNDMPRTVLCIRNADLDVSG